jgi:hypothetical protein
MPGADNYVPGSVRVEGWWVGGVGTGRIMRDVPDPAVNMIMVALVAAAASGGTPSSSIKGPFTTPPPMPNRPVTSTNKAGERSSGSV